jgi:hypothetical protein
MVTIVVFGIPRFFNDGAGISLIKARLKTLVDTLKDCFDRVKSSTLTRDDVSIFLPVDTLATGSELFAEVEGSLFSSAIMRGDLAAQVVNVLFDWGHENIAAFEKAIVRLRSSDQSRETVRIQKRDG